MVKTSFPTPLLQITAVPRLPHLADVRVQTFFRPLSETTVEWRLWSVVIPLSSTLSILPGVIFFSSLIRTSKSKNEFAFVLLNPLACAADVGSGVRKEMCRFKKGQPMPSRLLLNLFKWIWYVILRCQLIDKISNTWTS